MKWIRFRAFTRGLSDFNRYFEVTHHPAGKSDFSKSWGATMESAEEILLRLRADGWTLHEVDIVSRHDVPLGFENAVALGCGRPQ